VGKLIKYIFRYIMAVVLLFLCLTAWIVFDGLHDQGDRANAALVMGYPDLLPGAPTELVHDGLDRAIKFYNDKDVDFIIVTGSTTSSLGEPDAMAKYLEDKGISSEAIVKVKPEGSLLSMGQQVADILKSHQADSVIIVADYYNIAPTKLALVHEKLTQIGKAHVGTLQAQDGVAIGRAAYDLCEYISKYYVLPVAEKAKEEAESGMQKATVDAQEAKSSVDKKLDSMSK
jgi:DUF218 domain